jgi:hypothetical protein
MENTLINYQVPSKETLDLEEAYRKDMAKLPFEEKVKIMYKLRARARELRQARLQNA